MNIDTSIEDTIHAMASQYLTKQGVSDVRQYLTEGQIFAAKAYLCGALDQAVAEEDIAVDTYQAELERLGLTQEDVSKMRPIQ